MNLQHLRFLAVGITLGLLVALAPSCGKKCSPDNCKAGCCAKDVCVAPPTDAQCGAKGAACSACGSTQACTDGACKDVTPADGGMDGGQCDDATGVCNPKCAKDMDCPGPNRTFCDVQSGTCVPPCAKDDDCAALKEGLRCDQQAGRCIPGTPCNTTIGDSQCQVNDPNDYCYQFGVQCRCEPDTGVDAGSNDGVCRRRHGVCEECTTDAECGSSFVFDPLGACKQLQGDTSGKKYCLQQKTGQCPCGMIDDGTGYCKPQSNSCSQVGCSQDKDCPSGSVCSSTSCGICEPRCRWDFTKKETVPGCPPGKVCWVDEANLDPTSLFYGAGRCRPPCTSNADCAQSASNPFGGPKLICEGETLAGGGTSPMRCRADGGCMDDLECPTLPSDSHYNGYCDRGALECKTDCRLGNDPVTGQPYKDCRVPYACAADGGTNVCRLLTCVEQGGAVLACRQGQYCCGEDKDNDGKADPCPTTGLGLDNCYDAPVPPFCSTCMQDSDCQNLPLPPYMTGSNACANGSHSPNCSPLPYVCVQETMNTSVCAVPTWNDGTMVGVTTRAAMGCPVNYTPTIFRPNPIMGQDNNCNTDQDCNIGTDAGRCAVDNTFLLADGGHGKSCMCTVGVPGTCPNDPDAGLVSECLNGITGQTRPCITSLACLANPSLLFSDAGPPKFGCGLTP